VLRTPPQSISEAISLYRYGREPDKGDNHMRVSSTYPFKSSKPKLIRTIPLSLPWRKDLQPGHWGVPRWLHYCNPGTCPSRHASLCPELKWSDHGPSKATTWFVIPFCEAPFVPISALKEALHKTSLKLQMRMDLNKEKSLETLIIPHECTTPTLLPLPPQRRCIFLVNAIALKCIFPIARSRSG